MGYLWLLIKPAFYVFCFWFALEIGLRANKLTPGDYPYIVWLLTGMIPWFFMQEMLGKGVDVLHGYSFLVKKIKFPISCISTICATSALIIQLIMQVILFISYFLCGGTLDIHLIQVPFLLLLMFLFWDIVSMLFSQFSAYSRDFRNLMSALGTPFFWLSGVIFNIQRINIDWIVFILYFNPVTFFVSAFRDAIYYHKWIWEDPQSLICFGLVFLITFILTTIFHGKLSKEVADVL